MNSKTLDLSGHKVTVNKLPIGKIAKLIEGFKDLPPEIKGAFSSWDAETRDADFLFEHVPMLMTVSINKVSTFVVDASNSKELTEKLLLEDLGMDDTVDLIEAILEVNNIRGIIDKVKKMFALYTNKNTGSAKMNPMIKAK
jgi:hypothetical protein